jgi:hypothetical protein
MGQNRLKGGPVNTLLVIVLESEHGVQVVCAHIFLDIRRQREDDESGYIGVSSPV